MDTVDIMIRSATNFYHEAKRDENGRYRSWEHCYSDFYHARGKDNADLDYLSLQLAFYLASWGMYRGSSFLLQKDYKVHIPVVRELLKPQYDSLMGIACSAFKNGGNQNLFVELNNCVSKYYDKIRREVKEQDLKNQLSSTLISKILLGTLGCVPAYDRYFISGIKSQRVAAGSYSLKSVLQLANFYEKNTDRMEPIRNRMIVYDLPYPQMKMLDMGFWQIGFELDSQKDLKETQ